MIEDGPIADPTLELIRRIETRAASVDEKIDALVDLVTSGRAEIAAARADATALLKLYRTMDKRLERIEGRLGIAGAPAE